MLPDEQNYVPYSCNGSQKEFPITFSWYDEDTIKVYILNLNTLDESELDNPDDFSVIEGNVVTKKARSSDYKLFIYRILPIEQPIDFKTAGKISLEVIEKILDDYGRVLQQFRDMIARTPLLSPTSSIRNLAMEDPVEAFFLLYMSNKYRTVEHFGPSDYIIQAFMKLFLESLDAAEARGHIGAAGNVGELSDTEITGPEELDLIQQSGGKWKDKSLTEIFGALGDSNPWRHNRYTDAEAISAAVPVGTPRLCFKDSPPAGFLECDHKTLGKTGSGADYAGDTYKALYDFFGDDYGGTYNWDNGDTINLPDSRGLFPRFWDHGAGIDPDAADRDDRGDGIDGDHVGTKQADALQGHWHDLYVVSTEDCASGTSRKSVKFASVLSGASNVQNPITDGSNGTPRIKSESRGKNIYLMLCVKY